MRIVPRGEWSTGWRATAFMSLPADRLWVHHGATGQPTLPTLQAYHRYHLSQGWAGLGYSYAIVADGTVYEGRGTRVGAHTGGDNSRSLGVCLVGNWTTATVPTRMVEALADLARHLHDEGALRRLEITGGHRQATGATTLCPGAGGMAAIVRARQLLVPPTTIREDDDLTPEQAKKLDEIHTALGLDSGKPRRFDDDARRTRLGLRALGRKLGLKVDPNGDPDRDIVA